MDNDSSNLTTVVLFENTATSNLNAYYNKQSASSNYFQPLSLPNPTHTNLQPSTAFNPYDSTFILTWYDSTTSKLPYFTNGMNLSDPNGWTNVSEGYNDQTNITAPHPNVTIHHAEHSGACVWIADGADGKGVAMFDAQYSTYTGTPDNPGIEKTANVEAYPNPCNNETIIPFNLNGNKKVTISFYNIIGQKMDSSFESYSVGSQHIKVNTSKYPDGSYIYVIKTEGYSVTGKLFIVHN